MEKAKLQKAPRYSVSLEILQSILDYLGNKPYVEVSHLVKPLQEDAVLLDLPTELPKGGNPEEVIKEVIKEAEEKKGA